MVYILNIVFALQILLAGFTPKPVEKPAKVVLTISQWDSETLEKANTAINADYLSQEEKNIILYTNLARMNGPLFAETYLEEFLEKENIKNSKYVSSLKKDLKKSPSMQPLQPQKDLSEVAKGHAITSGKKGTLGHQGFEKRAKPVSP
ncbi:MAG: hypothetical protein H0X62_08010, partial [Bacteroidetes bacterium]|nr:hypothetical protein [Bacteroidota bacterium]